LDQHSIPSQFFYAKHRSDVKNSSASMLFRLARTSQIFTWPCGKRSSTSSKRCMRLPLREINRGFDRSPKTVELGLKDRRRISD
jgi:hypothetical protein